MEHITCNNFKLPNWYALAFLNIIFSEYTTLWEIRNLPSDLYSAPIWLEYLDVLCNDMRSLVELNLSEDLILEYKMYIRNNSWSNDLAIRRSCKNVDKAVKFLKKHFIGLKGLKMSDVKNRHLKIVK